MVAPTIDPKQYVGRAPEWLSVAEQRALQGWWMALEIYSPATTPLRRIEALGRSAGECREMLVARGLDPMNFEYMPLRAPF